MATTKELQAIAAELNTICKFTGNDLIKMNLTPRQFNGEFCQVATLLVAADLPNITPATMKYLKEIGAKLPKVVLTPEEREAAKKAKEAEKEAAKLRKAAGNYTRSTALYDAIVKGGTKEEIVKNSDNLFVTKMKEIGKEVKTKQGADYVPEAMFRYGMPLALMLGAVTFDPVSKVYTLTAKNDETAATDTPAEQQEENAA